MSEYNIWPSLKSTQWIIYFTFGQSNCPLSAHPAPTVDHSVPIYCPLSAFGWSHTAHALNTNISLIFITHRSTTQVNYSPTDKMMSHVLKIAAMIGTQSRMNVVWKRELNGRRWIMMSVTAARTSTTNAPMLNMMSCYEILISLVVLCWCKYLLWWKTMESEHLMPDPVLHVGRV